MWPPSSHPLPLATVSCGLFGVSEDFSGPMQSLDERFIKNKNATFFFEAQGESMAPTIRPGDILVVDRSLRAMQGRICVLAYQGELICKRVSLQEGRMVLLSDHPQHPPVVLSSEEEAQLWGVVIARAGELR